MKCIVIDDDKLIHVQIKKFSEKVKDCSLVGAFTSVEEALQNVDIDDIDLIFLDIEMPGMSGLEFLSALKTYPAIVIISAKEKYAIDAFDYEVDDYLLKPLDYTRFVKSIERVKDRLNRYKFSRFDQEAIFIKETSSVYRKIFFDEIFWIEALENYITIFTERGRHTIHFTMKAIEKILPEDKFMRIHRSYIINFRKIEVIEDNCVVIFYRGQKKTLVVARSYKDELLRRLKIIKS